MKEKGISNSVIEIICNKFHRSDDILDKKNWDQPLSGEPYYLSGAELVYLLFELEIKYNMRIDSNELDNYAFSTINNIVSIIENSQNAK
jgi:hypothetical protein